MDGFVAARRRNFDRLNDGLRSLEDVLILPEATANSEPSWFGFVITVRRDAPLTRQDVVRRLNEELIDTRLLFGGNLIRQPYMKGRDFRVVGELTSSDVVMDQTFWIGVYPGLTDAHIDYMVDTLHRVFGRTTG